MIKKRLICLCMILIGVIFVNSVEANEPEFKISVDAILPENQINKEVRYFDLKMKPSEEQKVIIRLTNHTSEKIDLKVAYSEAKTTSQGVIEYSENKELRINSPEEFLFPNVVSGPERVTLKEKETQDIELTIKMPNTEYDGFIAGGVEFIQGIEKEGNNGALLAQRSHLVGFKLSETDKELPINLELEQTIVGTKDYKNAILISLANKNGSYIEELDIDATISKKGESIVLLETRMSQLRVAPYSILEVPIFLEDNLLGFGDYELKLTAKSKDTYLKDWVQGFKVNKKDANILEENKKLWEKDNRKTQWVLYVVCGVISFLIIVGGTIIFLKRNVLKKIVKDKKNDKKRTLKKNNHANK